jgi:hypothetical protein
MFVWPGFGGQYLPMLVRPALVALIFLLLDAYFQKTLLFSLTSEAKFFSKLLLSSAV